MAQRKNRWALDPYGHHGRERWHQLIGRKTEKGELSY
jgi:hypothetical protein